MWKKEIHKKSRIPPNDLENWLKPKDVWKWNKESLHPSNFKVAYVKVKKGDIPNPYLVAFIIWLIIILRIAIYDGIAGFSKTTILELVLLIVCAILFVRWLKTKGWFQPYDPFSNEEDT